MKDVSSENTASLQMTEVEVLKFKNIILQRQILEKDNARLSIEESIVANEVARRLNIENPKEWIFDIDKGIVSKNPNGEKLNG